MLQALKAIVDCYGEGQYRPREPEHDFVLNVGEFIYHARKVIAKVEGRERSQPQPDAMREALELIADAETHLIQGAPMQLEAVVKVAQKALAKAERRERKKMCELAYTRWSSIASQLKTSLARSSIANF